MKKFIIAALSLALSVLVSTGAIFLASATEKSVNVKNFTDLNAFGQWVENMEWNESGFSGTIDNTAAAEGNKSGGLGLVKQFDVSEGKNVTLTFRKPIFSGTKTTENGERMLNEGQSAGEAVDVRFENKNNGKVALFRIWPDGAKAATQEASYVEVWNPTDPEWTKYDVSNWITGVATDTSSFTVGFNTKDFLCMDIAGGEYGKVKSNTAGYEEFLQDTFAGCETLEIYFGREIVAGTKDITVLLDVNSQNVVPAADGSLVDNVAPVVPQLKVLTEEIFINTAYSVRCEKWFDDPRTSADFFVRPVYDFISGNNVDLELVVSSDEGVNWTSVGEYKKTSGMITGVQFENVGTYQVAIRARDAVGNTAMGTPIEIDVIKGFDITLQGEMPESGEVGKTVTIPTAVSSDKNNQPHDVAVKVENPIGVEVELDNNVFVPNIAGIYYISYISEYTEGDKTYSAHSEYTISIVAVQPNDDKEDDNKPDKPDDDNKPGTTDNDNKPDKPEDDNNTADKEKNGCGSSIAAGSLLGVGGILSIISATMIRRKRK